MICGVGFAKPNQNLLSLGILFTIHLLFIQFILMLVHGIKQLLGLRSLSELLIRVEVLHSYDLTEKSLGLSTTVLWNC